MDNVPPEERSRSHHIRTVFQIMRIAWQVRPLATLGFYLGALSETSAFIVSIYATAKLGNLLAEFSAGHAHTGSIWAWLWVDIAGGIVIALSFLIMSWCKQLLYYRLVQWASDKFLHTLSTIDIADFYDENLRNLINKVQDGYGWRIPNFNQATMDLMYAIIRFIATAAVVTQITWWLIPLVALFLIPSLLAEARLAKVQWYLWGEKGDDRHIFWGLEWLLRRPKSQMELRSSQANAYALKRMSGINQRFYKQQEQKYRKVGKILYPAKLLEATGTTAGAIVLLRQFLHGSIKLDRYFFLSGALIRIGGSLNTIFGTLARMQDDLLFIEDYFTLTSRKPQIVDKPNALMLTTTQPPTIVFDKVSFTYPGHTKPVFTNLSFTINPGQHVAIVGENGAGKSTLIKLLLRFYVPTSGRILINGTDLQDLVIESWYDQLASLFQEFNQYPFSIRENIEVARPKHAGDQHRLDTVANQSSVKELVDEYKFGWDTVLDNSFKKGIEPSGGQWQRIALARAFYRQAKVLILDEPTAAIDAKAEYDIFNNIFEHYTGKSVIIVSHRFSTVRRANQIIVINKGKIVESGTHAQLMKQKGLYQEMFSKQAEGYR